MMSMLLRSGIDHLSSLALGHEGLFARVPSNAVGVQPARPAPVKYLRYAKVRRPQTVESQSHAPAGAPAAAQISSSARKSENIARSMPRYHKSRPREKTVAQNAAIHFRSKRGFKILGSHAVGWKRGY